MLLCKLMSFVEKYQYSYQKQLLTHGISREVNVLRARMTQQMFIPYATFAANYMQNL